MTKNYKEKLYHDPSHPELEAYQSYSFKYDIQDLDKLITTIRQRNKETKIVIITIAGLFDERIEPDERTMEIAYPITSINNLYAFSILTKKWNSELRKYAKTHGIDLIDFEETALTLFNPRSRYFSDSVHPRPEGYLRMGKHFTAEE